MTKLMSRPLFKFMVTAVVLAIPAVILSSFGNAAEEHHAEAGLPMIVIFQFINFFLYVGLIVYFGRKPIADYFKARQEKFYVALKRADAARAEAQAKRADIQARLAKLEATRDQSILDARKEAAELRTQIVEEARGLSERLKVEAERTAVVEIERATSLLRDDLLNQSVAMAQKILADKMQEQDQKRLQDEFVQKIAKSSTEKSASAAVST
ncbi:ATP synthase subunit B [soil metagenome]